MAILKPDGTVISTAAATPPPEPKHDGKRRLKDWLATFLDYTADALAPDPFLKWTGLATLAAAAQRKLYIQNKHLFTHTNMYVLLVGPPGSGKSIAIRIGRDMLKEIPGINLGSDAPSVVGVMDDFKDIPTQEHQSLSLFSLEFGSLYENAEKTMTGFLTALYDCDPNYRKRTRVAAKETIAKPWLNLLAGTTTAWLGDNLTKAAIEGGLVARTIYIHHGEPVLGDLARNPTATEKQMQADLVHDLAYISSLAGSFDFTPEAYAWFNNWQKNPARFPKLKDARTIGYYARKPMHLLKVAMARSLSIKDELLLTLDDLQIAKSFLEEAEPGMRRALSSVGGNTYATDLERIFAQVQSSETATSYSDIVSANYASLDKRLIDQTLQALEAMGCIRRATSADLEKMNGAKLNGVPYFVALRSTV